MVSLAFILGLAALLATPGPTNTLLMLGGASRRGWPLGLTLLAAELGAYLAAVCLIGLVVDRLLGTMEGLRLGLQLAAAAYLATVSVLIWRRGAARGEPVAVTPRMVALATLTNPKALIIAVPMMPAKAFADPAVLLPHLAMLALLVPAMGACWFWLGTATARGEGTLARRALPSLASLALATFSLLLVRSALAG